MRIRGADQEDVEAVARVHVQAWRETYVGLLTDETLAGLSVDERIRMWRAVLAQSGARTKLLAAQECDGSIVGFACAGPMRSQGAVALDADAEIYAIYLLARAQRRGIGRRLMGDLFHQLSQDGFSAVGLWVLAGNLAARRFYERLGGRAGPEQTLDFGTEAVVEIAYLFDLHPRQA